MYIRKIDEAEKKIFVSCPLTSVTGKTRIKKRSILNDYGIPVATRQKPFDLSCYVEWQIGYDIKTSDADKLKNTTTPNKTFIGANGYEKTLYELSEYIFYFYKWGIIKEDQILKIKDFLTKANEHDLIDTNADYAITRSHAVPKEILGIDFEYTQVKYPLLIHKFSPYEIVTEIKVTEKQRAVGTQPMLYFCFPITELSFKRPILGRTAESSKTADFIVDKDNIFVFLEAIKIFGILSSSHKQDILSILSVVLNSD